MRQPRWKTSEEAFYHFTSRVAGDPKFFPFHNKQAARKLQEMIIFYLSVYRLHLVGFQIMGNHYHFIARKEKHHEVSRPELKKSAKKLFGKRYQTKTGGWSNAQWRAFNDKLFDISALMQHINGEYGKWYNRTFGRRGHLWGDRYKNPRLLDREAVQECLLYIELNPVRAGLVNRPEEWRWSSARWRWSGKTRVLVSLKEIFPFEHPFALYRARLYHRGAVRTKERQAVIPTGILVAEKRRGFSNPGLFKQPLRFFTDGLAIGKRHHIQHLIDRSPQTQRHPDRYDPVSQLSGLFFSLRGQRLRPSLG